jgi:pimeloyl-ACP methyl ester carboxylesterase/DNA-binding winged helix-turn-helix (wHTH) protein
LDPARGRLLRGDSAISLAPKPFALLHYLAARPGELVTKQTLLDALWPNVYVGDAVLKVTIRDVRKALGDDPKSPRFVETAHRRGYRFIADVTGLLHEPSAVAVAPKVRYAHGPDVNIAYQVLGSGPVDLVFVMGWVSHLEYFWREPHFAQFLTRLSTMARLILFDKRGTGLSDPVPISRLPTLEERLDDVMAVMEAAGSERAVLMGVSEGGPLCALFSATYPDKTEALIMVGSYARRLASPDYPWGQSDEAARAFGKTILDDWGGPVGIEARAPSLADDAEFREWWATYLRMGASPGAAVALTEMNARIDVRDVLPFVRVPTLVIHRAGDRCLPAEGGRYLASRIPGAQYVELPGADHLPFVGNQDEILDPIAAFLARTRAPLAGERTLASALVMLTQGAADREPVVAAFDAHVDAGRGLRVGRGDVSLAAVFDGPGRAVRCGLAVAALAERLGTPIRAAVHVGELDRATPEGLVALTAELASAAPDNVVLVSRTVVDLVPGSGLEFTPRGSVCLDVDRRDVPVYSVV